MVTTQPDIAPKMISGTSFNPIKIFKCDFTAIRTAARTNPCLFILREGTILNKLSYKRMNTAMETLKNIPAQKILTVTPVN